MPCSSVRGAKMRHHRVMLEMANSLQLAFYCNNMPKNEYDACLSKGVTYPFKSAFQAHRPSPNDISLLH